jgi:hypothetical protein
MTPYLFSLSREICQKIIWHAIKLSPTPSVPISTRHLTSGSFRTVDVVVFCAESFGYQGSPPCSSSAAAVEHAAQLSAFLADLILTSRTIRRNVEGAIEAWQCNLVHDIVG